VTKASKIGQSRTLKLDSPGGVNRPNESINSKFELPYSDWKKRKVLNNAAAHPCAASVHLKNSET
jgi:hypothetical protein